MARGGTEQHVQWQSLAQARPGNTQQVQARGAVTSLCEGMPGSLAPLLGPSPVHCKLTLHLSCQEKGTGGFVSYLKEVLLQWAHIFQQSSPRYHRLWVCSRRSS